MIFAYDLLREQVSDENPVPAEQALVQIAADPLPMIVVGKIVAIKDDGESDAIVLDIYVDHENAFGGRALLKFLQRGGGELSIRVPEEPAAA